jgi:hypothetical protein
MVQVKFYLVLHGTSKTIGCCILGGVYQVRVLRVMSMLAILLSIRCIRLINPS